MCGIAGFLSSSRMTGDCLSNMAQTMAKRGPDDEGLWFDADAGIGLAHRRLSIIDLSNKGHQPMASFSGRYVIVYNGELYNFKDIRRELDSENIPWRSHSDTEVLLAAIEIWGLEAALTRFNGMFAFALWDRKEHVLWLCRDRLGIKPLYYARIRKGIIFGSELKAIKAHPDFNTEIDRAGLTLYLRYNCIPAPYTIYKNTWKVPPGNILKISLDDLKEGKEVQPFCYWEARVAAELGQDSSFQGTIGEAIEQLDSLLRDAVKKRMLSDVSLGAFLSGGIDSSTVVALMQAQSDEPVKTFSIGSEIQGYNEATYAKEVALHLGTDHTELYVNPQEAMDVIPELPTLFDEPFSDSSQIPTFLVSKLARHCVTVSLSGDGGDELFGGYNRHFLVPEIWKKTGWMHPALKTIVANGLLRISPAGWNDIFYRLKRFMPKSRQFSRMGDNIHKFANILPLKNPEIMYRGLCSHWVRPEEVVIEGYEPLTPFTNSGLYPDLPDLSHRMMYMDLITYLPDDILTKVDRTSMAVSLEARVPFLDHRLVEFAWHLPLSMKIRNGKGKWILRQVLNKYVPSKLIERPKMGFGIPIDSWLRGPLLDWAETLIDQSRLQKEGFFNPEPIRQKWAEHLAGKKNWAYHLWDVLMFQAWLENERNNG